MTEPIERIRRWMKHEQLDAVLLRTRANFSWVTGGGDSHIIQASEYGIADLIVLGNKVVCVTNRIESRRIKDEELSDLDIELVAVDWIEGTQGALSDLLSQKRVGADVPGIRIDGVNAIDISSQLSLLRRTLNPQQVLQYRFVCVQAAQALEKIAREIQPGQTEFEIAAMLAAEVMRRECMPAVTLVSTDDRLFRYRHPIPTTKRLERHAMIVICAEKYGLVANATRFVHFGPLPKEIKENQEKCAYIDVRMNSATRPGVGIADVFQVARDAYREVGYPDDWKWLHQGGPTGYASREYLATPYSQDVVCVNQAYAWNPALYGVKSEDTILVGERENEFITATGEWPTVEVKWDGRAYQRPAILVR